ncbi:MAG: DUF6212 domain-containing protein [Candidatus Devosia phytovorans]|uniref:DUF6212 domain-containing protein n=1 Tax=Candidatus Devosia phytovorans TaxID=3121372 RepID=A0AAJ5VU41_9HYPH|nr:DUF6212 domain-containing protein [Devosia sp.]WEK03632.1 MAG: DUF6212 domain-containing protein [Devosia sp.]
MMPVERDSLQPASIEAKPVPHVVHEVGEGGIPSIVPLWPAPPIPQPANDDGYGDLERQLDEQRRLLLTSAQRRVAALRRLTGLRRINEDLQNCFHGLERVLPPDAAGLSLTFQDEPGVPDSKLTLGWSSNGLAQVLPVSSTGISAFELRLSDIRAGHGATLHVHLVSPDDHRVVDRWTVPLEDTSAGWTMFCLTAPIVGPTHGLEVRLDVECDEDVHVALSLGAGQTVAPFRARNPVLQVDASPRGLAMRVWCGDAHGSFGRHGNALVADGRRSGADGLVDVPLSPGLIAQVQHVDAEPAVGDFKAVSWVPYRVAVACHPPAHGFTLACLPLPSGMAIRGIGLDVEVGNPKSRTVEFAMVVASDAERAKTLLEGTATTGAEESFSGWVAADFDAGSSLLVQQARPFPRGSRVYLATRMLVAGNRDYAWARFRRIALKVHL